MKVPQAADPALGEKFQAAVLAEPAIVACYITTGQFDYLLKVIVPGIEEYGEFLTKTLLRLPGLQDSSSTFVPRRDQGFNRAAAVAGIWPSRSEGENGAPGTIRTSDPQIRSLMLYPAELRARREGAT